MSKKRTSPESSIDKQTNEDSDSFQQDENTKRAKFTSVSDTTLHDLPMELVESILVKAVAVEVMGITRKKSLWKEAAEPVINRLTTVCSQWSCILATTFFRNELHRTFDAEKTIRLEIVQTFRFTGFVLDAIALKDELFIIYLPRYDDICRYNIHVYDRNNVAMAKDIIPLPGVEVADIAACSVSNCLYLLNTKAHHLSVLRLTKTNDHQFNISPLISGMRRRYDTMIVAANGNLILSWEQRKEQRAVIAVYGPNGQLLQETWLSSDLYSFFYKVIPKSNGNFVLVGPNDQWETKLTEIDMSGIRPTILRQYQSSLKASGAVCQADKHGRFAIVKQFSGIELLGSKLNPMEYNGLPPDEDQFNYWDRMHYNAERDEVLILPYVHVVTVFRFTEE